ncbi:MAG: Tetratricopeptide TPR1 repeat-containing protein [Elusimicrobia bacterium]|nr:MAG: Tetratricopeptide TPR1 repeat-containing protein [Elusimicrobiota bacterium]KAF0156031.1 MAG: Tetratricopeptide TPR1 repeat-containing protein [Elusimicrobiota bacterium]
MPGFRPFAIAAALFAAFAPPAGASQDAGLPGSFLLQPAGGRGAALGGVYPALVSGPDSAFWNPAGLGAVKKPELALAQSWLLEDTGHSFMGFAYPGWRGIGLAGAYIRQAGDGYERRTGPFDAPRSFSVGSEAFMASAGRKLTLAGLSAAAGLTFKAVRQFVDDSSGGGWGADAGVLAGPWRGLTFAITLKNLARPSFAVLSREITYPSGINYAAAWSGRLSADLDYSAGFGLEKYERGGADLSAGAELAYKGAAFLRVSAGPDGLASGAGLKAGNYSLDYAVFLNDFAPVHTINLGVRFGITMDELENYIKRGISRFDRQDAARLAGAYLQQAEMQHKAGDVTRAVKTLETALLWDPADEAISSRLEKYRAELDDKISGQVIERTRALAGQYYARGDFIASREYWAGVLSLDPGNAEASGYIAGIDERLDRGQKDLLLREKAEEAKRKAYALIEEASALLRAEKYAQAAARAKKALQVLPGDAQAKSVVAIAERGLALSLEKRLGRAAELCDAGAYAKALEVIESVLGDDPGNKEAAERKRICRAALAPSITEAQRKALEKTYYMAVDSYLKGDYTAARGRVGEILDADPLNDSALKLSEKIDAAGRGRR